MRTYMACCSEPIYGALLVFAHDLKEAKRLAYPAVQDWNRDMDYIDLYVTWLRNRPWLFKDADPAKLAADIGHVNEEPTGCSSCELWGAELDANGECPECAAMTRQTFRCHEII